MSLFHEFKRRRVFRVAVVYAATAFAVLQGADILLPNLGVPGSAMGFLMVVVLLGFPIALELAWALEVTPHDIKRAGDAPKDVATTALLALDRPDALLTLLEWDNYLFDRLSALVWSADQAALRRDPRFVQYLRRQGVTELRRETGRPPDCRENRDTWRCGLAAEATD